MVSTSAEVKTPKPKEREMLPEHHWPLRRLLGSSLRNRNEKFKSFVEGPPFSGTVWQSQERIINKGTTVDRCPLFAPTTSSALPVVRQNAL